MKRLPIGIQTFSRLIQDNYVYVDKTEYIHQLIQENSYYFLARPRRFGKSLLISTLKEIFLGNKEIFKGLWIGEHGEIAWKKHPIIHLDFSGIAHRDPEQLEQSLKNNLFLIANEYQIDIMATEILEDVLNQLVKGLSKQNTVVILIDEYDYPMVYNLHNIDLAKAQQAILRSFYSAIKSLNAYIEFVFITGITKFAKNSLFSGLNNLKDISNTIPGAELLGYTQQELEENFKDRIERIATQENINSTQVLAQIKTWYNGYRFSPKNVPMYNPFSVLLYLDHGFIDNYWFESGTPSFLFEELRTHYKELAKTVSGKIGVTTLGAFTLEKVPLVTLLFQTGYLTIKAFDPVTREYRLGFPNKEVETSFEKHLLAVFTYQTTPSIEGSLIFMKEALRDNDMEEFFLQLKSLFANIPYHQHIKQEKFYHAAFQLIGTLLGMEMQSEVATDKGRIDMVISLPNFIYILEFKFDEDPEVALKQIEDKKYYEKYIVKKKPIVAVGVSFNRKDEDLEIEFVTKEINYK